MMIERLLQSWSQAQRRPRSNADAALLLGDGSLALPGFNRLVSARHGLFVANPNDVYIGRALIEYGEFSELEWQLLQRYCIRGGVIADIGANIGAHTITLAKAVGESGRVVAVEPQSVIFQTLCANVALNCLLNVDAMNCGCGEDANATFVVPALDYGAENNFGGIALTQASGTIYSKPVRMETLTAVLSGYQRLDLVKVDVEGMEEVVLGSGSEAIERFRPVLYVENDRVTRSKSLIDTVRALGYRLWWHAPPLFNPQNYFQNTRNLYPGISSFNMLCIPEERAADFPQDLEEVTSSDFTR